MDIDKYIRRIKQFLTILFCMVLLVSCNNIGPTNQSEPESNLQSGVEPVENITSSSDIEPEPLQYPDWYTEDFISNVQVIWDDHSEEQMIDTIALMDIDSDGLPELFLSPFSAVGIYARDYWAYDVTDVKLIPSVYINDRGEEVDTDYFMRDTDGGIMPFGGCHYVDEEGNSYFQTVSSFAKIYSGNGYYVGILTYSNNEWVYEETLLYNDDYQENTDTSIPLPYGYIRFDVTAIRNEDGWKELRREQFLDVLDECVLQYQAALEEN